MTKIERFSLIKAICLNRGIPSMPKGGIAVKVKEIKPSQVEIREEKNLIKINNDDESIIDVETNISIISDSMAKITGEARRFEHHIPGEECLTASERRQAQADLAAYRERERPKWWLVPAGFFARNAFCA